MYSIKKTGQNFTEYKVVDDNTGSSFTILPEWGGLVSDFRVNDSQILYFDNEILKNERILRAGGIPILFPICAGLADGFATVNGQRLEVPRHGFARILPWKITDKAEGQKGSITISLQSDDYTKSVYPYEFNLVYKYALRDNELQIIHSIVNTGNTDMPVHAGFHPFFNVGKKDMLKFNIDADTYDDNVAGAEKSFNGNVDFNQPIDFVFNLKDKKGHSYEMIDNDFKRKISISTSDVYKYMILWTVKEKNYVCVEPWMGKPNALNTGAGLEWIKPGHEMHEYFNIKVSDI